MKKRKITFILLLCMIMASLAGCGKSAAEENVKVEGPSSDADKMKKYDPEITLTFAKAEVVTNYPEGRMHRIMPCTRCGKMSWELKWKTLFFVLPMP